MANKPTGVPIPTFKQPIFDGENTTRPWYFFFQSLYNKINAIVPGTGTITSIATGTGLTGGPITVTGTVALANTAVTPGSYTNTNLTVNQQGQITAATSGSGGASNVNPDTHPSSPTAFDDEFESGSSIDLTGARRSGAKPWAWTNQNSSTAAVTEGSLVLTPIAGGGRNTAILTQSLSGVSAPWTFTVKFQADQLGSGSFAGMVLAGTGGYLVFGVSGTNSTTLRWNVQNLSSPTALAGNVVTSPSLVNVWNFTGTASTDDLYLQISIDGTGLNFTYSASVTGVPGTFVAIGTSSLAAFLTAVTAIGVAADLNGGGSSLGVYDWFRKTA